MMEFMLKDARARNIDFVLVQGFSPSGMGLYRKFGFMLYGQNGTLVRAVRSNSAILHPNTYRAWDVEWMKDFNERGGKRRSTVGYRKSQDTYERRKAFFGTPSFKSDDDKNTPDMIVPDSMIREIRPYPDWAYKYAPKSAWPF